MSGVKAALGLFQVGFLYHGSSLDIGSVSRLRPAFAEMDRAVSCSGESFYPFANRGA